jgi:hypothetical protein
MILLDAEMFKGIALRDSLVRHLRACERSIPFTHANFTELLWSTGCMVPKRGRHVVGQTRKTVGRESEGQTPLSGVGIEIKRIVLAQQRRRG